MKPDFPSPETYVRAAGLLSCDVRFLRAIGEVEAGPLGAFLDSGEPVILFERHKFDSITAGKHRDAHVIVGGVTYQLSSPHPGGYGPSSIQHEKLAAAVRIDRSAALQACSWGLFQLMGFNYVRCGFPDRTQTLGGIARGLQEFVNAMCRGADEHLVALCYFIRSDNSLLHAVRERDCLAFARLYNGVNFAVNHYDQKLADALEAQ